VDLVRIQLGGDARVVGHVGEEYGDDLALPLDGGARSEDLLGQEFRGVGARVEGIEGRRGIGFAKVMATLAAELSGGGQGTAAVRAECSQKSAAAETEPGTLRVIVLALEAVHGCNPGGKRPRK
jgi:hypothetical protein